MKLKTVLPPFALPILFFALLIGTGSILLHLSASSTVRPLGWIDALFTATSATCVTGLAVVDTGASFSRFGQSVLLVLMQAGGLGIMTFTGLAFYLWRRRVSLNDRLAIGQTLLHDPTFHLGRFLLQLVTFAFAIEGAGSLLLYLLSPLGFPPFSAVFHAVSAFCNAGFSLHSDSLAAWRTDWGINLTFMLLIILGGIGFSVLIELRSLIGSRMRWRLSWYSKVVLSTSFFLIALGGVALFLAEYLGGAREGGIHGMLLASFFQSVTSRTAGFNTVDIGGMTNVSLLILLFLMMIGGAPGSCAGGIKVTTFRTLVAFVGAQIKGQRQAVIGKFALDRDSLNNAQVLMVFSVAIILIAIMILDITEGGDTPHPLARGQFIEILFEAVSAFGTVGLSTGITAKLSAAGKCVIMALMFIGRLGPLVFLAALQGAQKEKHYSLPEERVLIG